MRMRSLRPKAPVAIAGLLCALACAATTRAQGTRLTDKEVKLLFERVRNGIDRFEGALDDQLKRSILRGPYGEVDVRRYLQDFKDNVEKLEGRFRPEYAASAEALPVLRQASGLHRYLERQPSVLKGRSEWEAVSGDFRSLAATYGTEFPLDEGITSVRRMNDREVAAVADQLARGANTLAKELEGALKADKSLDKPARAEAVGSVNGLEAAAKGLKSRLSGGHPATVEARQLMEKAASASSVVSGRTLPPAAGAAWQGVGANLEKIAQAFALPPPAR